MDNININIRGATCISAVFSFLIIFGCTYFQTETNIEPGSG